MTRQYEQRGDILDHTAAADVNVDDTVVMGNIVGVALADIAAGETKGVAVDGVYQRAKTTGTAWSQGDVLDYDVSAGEFHKGLTPATGDITGCAIAAEDAASADAVGKVLLRAIPGTVN